MAEPLKEFEDEISNALDIDLSSGKVKQWPRKALENAEVAPQVKALDQVRTAIDGLLKVEAEFTQLAQDLVGDVQEETEELQPSKDGPLIPRLRSDAELLARLAIRFHNRIKEIKNLL